MLLHHNKFRISASDSRASYAHNHSSIYSNLESRSQHLLIRINRNRSEQFESFDNFDSADVCLATPTSRKREC